METPPWSPGKFLKAITTHHRRDIVVRVFERNTRYGPQLLFQPGREGVSSTQKPYFSSEYFIKDFLWLPYVCEKAIREFDIERIEKDGSPYEEPHYEQEEPGAETPWG